MPTAFRQSLFAPWRHRTLVRLLTWREIAGRYRGSLLGSLWSLLTPLLTLAVFTFVFGVVMPARWPGVQDAGIGMFALVILSGMLLHGLLAEVISRAPGLVLAHPNYVTKVVFPLEVLGWVALLGALFHSGLAMLVLVVVNGVWGEGFAWAQIAVPLVVLPLAVLVTGVCWVFASLAVYVRDLAQITAPLVMVLMFLSPVFYPLSAMPEPMRGWVHLNPITVPVLQLRRLLFEGLWPDWSALMLYSVAAVAIYALGLWVFSTLKRGFADVL